jgi:hypothetical protein
VDPESLFACIFNLRLAQTTRCSTARTSFKGITRTIFPSALVARFARATHRQRFRSDLRQLSSDAHPGAMIRPNYRIQHRTDLVAKPLRYVHSAGPTSDHFHRVAMSLFEFPNPHAKPGNTCKTITPPISFNSHGNLHVTTPRDLTGGTSPERSWEA